MIKPKRRNGSALRPAYRMPLMGPHPMYTGESGTQCLGCWGWVDDPRHTSIRPTQPPVPEMARQGTHNAAIVQAMKARGTN